MPDESKDEMYAKVPNSFEDKMSKVRDAIRKSTLFGVVENEWSLSIEATFADSVLVEKSEKTGSKYYKADWSLNENGDVVISNVKDVEVDMVIKIKNEQLQSDDMKILNESQELNEDMEAKFLFEKIDKDGGDDIANFYIDAEILQKPTSNKNRRMYPKHVLKEAADNLIARIKADGPILAEMQHPPKETFNKTDLNEVVAVIPEIVWNEDRGTIGGKGIKFIPTEKGKNLFEIAKTLNQYGASLGMSQRGNGPSHHAKNEKNEIVEIVDKLYIKKFDFTANGEQSVKEAKASLHKLSEEIEMPDKKILTEEEIDGKFTSFKDTILNEIKTLIKPAEAAPADPPKPQETPKPEGDKTAETLNEMKKTVDTLNEALEAQKREKGIVLLTEQARTVLNEELKDEKFKAFGTGDKKTIVDNALKHTSSLYDSVDMTKPDDVKTKVVGVLNEHIEEIMPIIAASRLATRGYGNGAGNGIQSVEIINENYADGELTGKLTTLLNERFDKKLTIRPTFTDINHPVMQYMKEVEAKHIQDIQKNIAMGNLLNEATMIGTDVGPKIASVGISLIRAVFPRLSALQICSLGTMEKIQDIITVQAFSQAISANPYTNITVLTPGEDQSLNTVKTTTSPYPIIATQKAVGGQITSLANAIARGSQNIDPIADTLEGIAKYFQTTINHLIWWSIICKAQAYLKTEVSSFTQLTLVSGSTYEFESTTPGWIQFEWVKKLDTNGNPVYAQPLPLYGTVSADTTYQEVVVEEHGGDHTALVYGSTNDYTVNWADGTITLTAAGLAKCATDNTPEAKWSYTTNLNDWSIITPAGLTGEDALKNLGLEVGKSKSLVRNRDYEPTFAAMNFDNNDMIANSPIYTNSGNRAGNILDSRGDMSRWLGLDVAGDRMIPSEWIIVGTQGKAIYNVQSPMSIKRVPVSGKTNEELQVEQYDCVDCPEPAAFSLVAIKDINT